MTLGAAESIAVLLTPSGRGAVASLLFEGEQALTCLEAHFVPSGPRPVARREMGEIALGRWRVDDAAPGVGEELVVCRRGPRRFEIHCHGGDAAAKVILDSLAARGCRVLEWSHWVEGEEAEDAIRASARRTLAEAATGRTAAILLDQYHGALRRAVNEAIAAIDAGDTPEAKRILGDLLRYAPVGRRLITPWRIVLAGRPNVGKSSLINALVGYPRSIVFDAPGTTRDVVSTRTALDGWEVELSDTAGLSAAHGNPGASRASKCFSTATGKDKSIEETGVARAKERMRDADLVVFVCDASRGRWQEDLSAAEDACRDGKRTSAPDRPLLLAVNKIDIADLNPHESEDVLGVSALTGQGIDRLCEAIINGLISDPPKSSAAVPFTEAQIGVISQAFSRMSRQECVPARELLESL